MAVKQKQMKQQKQQQQDRTERTSNKNRTGKEEDMKVIKRGLGKEATTFQKGENKQDTKVEEITKSKLNNATKTAKHQKK